ncbi:Glutathione S-transferase 4, partial [Dichanthelium oligosanthes]
MSGKWLRSATLTKSPARYLLRLSRASYTSSTGRSLPTFSSTTAWSRAPPSRGVMRHSIVMAPAAGWCWCASSSSHTSTMADSSRPPPP